MITQVRQDVRQVAVDARRILGHFRALAERAAGLEMTDEEKDWLEEQMSPVVDSVEAYLRESGLLGGGM